MSIGAELGQYVLHVLFTTSVGLMLSL